MTKTLDSCSRGNYSSYSSNQRLPSELNKKHPFLRHWSTFLCTFRPNCAVCFCCETPLTSGSCLAPQLSFFNVFTRCFKLRSVSTRPCLSLTFPVLSGPPLGEAPFCRVPLGMLEVWFLFLRDKTSEEVSRWRSSCDITPAWSTKAVSSLCWI